MSAAGIAHLKITLDEVIPPVLRRIEVPLTIRLDRLHLALQAAMGWTNSHLYEIRARDVRWGVPDPDWGDGPLEARKARLINVLEDVGAKTLQYLYDFGDRWEHTIRIERITEALPGVAYPRLTEAKGRCPPKTSAVPGAMPTSSTQSLIQSMSAMRKWWNGLANPLIPLWPIARDLPGPSPHSPDGGHENRPTIESKPPDPRCSADGYEATAAGRVPLATVMMDDSHPT
jgi:hypothetical protein